MADPHQSTDPRDAERLARMHVVAFDAAVDAQAEVRRLREALRQIAWPGQRRPVVPEGPTHEAAILIAREALGDG